MTHPEKVAVITGASQGIGAALVPAYRKLGYAVVAASRSIAESDDPEVLTVPGDVAEPGAGARSRRRGPGPVRPGRHAGQQRRHLHRQAVHRLHRRGL